MAFTRLSYVMMVIFLFLMGWKLDSHQSLFWVSIFGSVFLCTACVTFSSSLQLTWVSMGLSLLFIVLIFLWSKSFFDTTLASLISLENPTETQLKVQEFWALSAGLVWTLTLVFRGYLFPKAEYSWLKKCGSI